MTYDEARRFESEAAKRGSIFGLASIRHLMRVLKDPQEELTIIHIAGTNGKGSVGAFMDSIFREAGFSVGRFCSPAVFSHLEMWQLDGHNISKEEYAKVMSRVKGACDIVFSESRTKPTVFEIQTAAAFCYFAEKKPDIVLLEAGLGGAEDATNVVSHPLCCLFTSISYDHSQQLGDTLVDIAGAKAGIIKEGCPVLSVPQEPEVETVIRRAADEKHAPAAFIPPDKINKISQRPEKLVFYYRDVRVISPLVGSFQMANASLAIKASYYILAYLKYSRDGRKEYIAESQGEAVAGAEQTTDQKLQPLEQQEDYPEIRSVARTLELRSMSSYEKMSLMVRILNGISNTRWPGRFEVLGTSPYFIIDGAHNEGAARQLADTLLDCFPEQKLIFLIGVLSDKEYQKILEIMLPFAQKVYTLTPDSDRALPGGTLCESVRSRGVEAVNCESVEEAVAAALKEQEPVLAFGSLTTLNELRECYNKI